MTKSSVAREMMKRNRRTIGKKTGPSPDKGGRSASKRRKRVFRLIACGVPVVLGLAVIVSILVAQERFAIDPETGRIRFQSPPIYIQEPSLELSGHRFLYDPLLGWRNIPNWRATTFGHKLTINSRGLRDREYPYEKPPEVSRIVVLGDSYAWGYGVADDEVFAEVLETRLLEAEGKWEFLNTDLELANVPVPPPDRKQTASNSQADPLELVIAIISRIADACSQSGCRLVVMKFGRFVYPENPKYLRWEARFESLRQERLTVSYIDIDDHFDARSIPREKFDENSPLEGHDGVHWNACGHRVAAEVLHHFLKDAGFLLRRER